jgi:hypothetical protein
LSKLPAFVTDLDPGYTQRVGVLGLTFIHLLQLGMQELNVNEGCKPEKTVIDSLLLPPFFDR